MVQLRVGGRVQSGCYGGQVACVDGDVKEQVYRPEQATGQVLKDEFARAARAAALDFFTSGGCGGSTFPGGGRWIAPAAH